MIYPIHVYGSPVLRKVAEEIDENYPDLQTIIQDMWRSMEISDGVGLAAPQIGLSIRLFVIDTEPMSDDDESLKNFRKVFINAKIVEESGDAWSYNEGCLSVPTIREDVVRKSTIRIQYYDENFNFFDEVFDGIKARVIQHEYDHLQGKLLIDHVSPLKKRLLKRKLNDISKGNVEVNYKIVSPLKK
jgi:peptide deformylase